MIAWGHIGEATTSPENALPGRWQLFHADNDGRHWIDAAHITAAPITGTFRVRLLNIDSRSHGVEYQYDLDAVARRMRLLSTRRRDGTQWQEAIACINPEWISFDAPEIGDPGTRFFDKLIALVQLTPTSFSSN